MHERDASIAHCPTSNLFLGSGLFRLRVAKDKKRPIHVGLGTDIGAGTSFSVLRTINEAYKIAALNAAPISAFELSRHARRRPLARARGPHRLA